MLDREGDIAAAVRERHPDGVDALLELVSYAPDGFNANAAALKPGGRGASPLSAAGDGPGRANVMATPSPENLERVAQLLEAGTLRVPILSSYRLDQAGDALHALGTTHTQGKIGIRACALARAVAPAAATTTSAIATHSRAPSAWPSTTSPASAATAGSSDISTPNTRAGSRRSASSSSEYGITDEASATAAPAASSSGSQQRAAGLADAHRQDRHGADRHRDREPGAAGEQPPGADREQDVGRPHRRRQQREGDADACRASRRRDPPAARCRPRRARPTAGRAAGARRATATASGPQNSIVTAMPSGIRSIA